MKTETRKTALNRALFINRPLDSRALGALVTLLHPFMEAGDYELFVRRDGGLVYRGAVKVVGELRPPAERKVVPTGAANQINLDLATIEQGADDCEPNRPHVLAVGGVLGFYVSSGVGHYTVTITRTVGEKRETVLDNAAGLPEGDLFAVTLVRPGVYTATNPPAGGRATLRVEVPKREGYRPDQVTLVQAGQGGIDPGELSITSGQSIIFQCRTACNLVVEMVDPGPSAPTRSSAAAGERPKYTVRKRNDTRKP